MGEGGAGPADKGPGGGDCELLVSLGCQVSESMLWRQDRQSQLVESLEYHARGLDFVLKAVRSHGKLCAAET